jgi:Na+/proline symporter
MFTRAFGDLVASLITSLLAFQTIPQRFAAGDPNADATIMLVTVAVSTVVWLTVTYLTAPEPDSVLEPFYRRVRPGGAGWSRISQQAGFGREGIAGGALAWTNWIAGVVAVYATLFGIGKLIFGDLVPGLIMLAIAAGAFAWIAKSFRQDGSEGADGAGPDAMPDAPALSSKPLTP